MILRLLRKLREGFRIRNNPGGAGPVLTITVTLDRIENDEAVYVTEVDMPEGASIADVAGAMLCCAERIREEFIDLAGQGNDLEAAMADYDSVATGKMGFQR